MNTAGMFAESGWWLRSVVENSSEIITILDPDGTLRYASPAFARILGYSLKEVVGTNFLDYLHPEDLPHVLEKSEKALSEGGVARNVAEYRFLHKDGSWRWMEGFGTYLLNDPAVSGIVVNARDVTGRKEMESQLREAEERFRSAFEDAAIGMALVTPVSLFPALDRRYLRVNEAFCEMLGYTEELLLSMTSTQVTHSEDRQRSRDRIKQMLEEGGSKYTIEKRYIRSDGRIVWALLNVSLVRDSEGNPSHFAAQYQDITERKEAEEALQKSETNLAEAQRMAHLGSWEWDIQSGESWWSDETFRIYGFKPKELLPTFEKFINVVHPDDRKLVKKTVEDALYGYGPYEFEHRIVRPNGEVRVVYRQAEVVRGEKSEPLRMVGTVHDITEWKTLQGRLEYQAFHDPLTDLPNRKLFVDRLKQALKRTERQGSRVAVLFMDLDDFKVVNDSLGHETGDRLLVDVAERLCRFLRAEDTLARFGGDEFVVLVEDIEEPEEAVWVTQRLLEGLREPFILAGRELFIGASIGIALGDMSTKTPEDLLRDADTAMYQAKGDTGGYCLYDPVMYEWVVQRLSLENNLRRAIEAEEFVVHYQPQVSLQTGEVWGVEALVRWDHPKRGLLRPSEFVPIAEQTGLIIPMGEQVLKEACRWAREWQSKYVSISPLMICVNLSTRQLRRMELANTVEETLQQTGVKPSALSLDVTETAYIGVLEDNIAALDRLKKIGVRISIDDFGMGYSSLSYLKRLPADTLKIDKSFVAGLATNIEDTALVRMVVDLAHTLGMKVVAEGVESQEQMAMLREMGCDIAQGFYVSTPLSPEAVSEFLDIWDG